MSGTGGGIRKAENQCSAPTLKIFKLRRMCVGLIFLFFLSALFLLLSSSFFVVLSFFFFLFLFSSFFHFLFIRGESGKVQTPSPPRTIISQNAIDYTFATV